MNEFDLVVIGAGASGISAAMSAAQLGASVALVEKNRVGGQHLWAGEVPLHALAKSAQVFQSCKQAVEFGVNIENSRLIWSAVKLRIADVRDDIRRIQREELAAANVEVISGEARFEDESTLRIADKNGERLLQGKKFIVAAGRAEVAPNFEGLHEVGFITPERLFNLPALPRSIIIIGHGANACVLAQTLARLNSRVTLLAHESTLLPGEDAEVAEFVAKILTQEGVTLHLGAAVRDAHSEGERKGVSFGVDGETHTASASEILLVPSTETDLSGLNLEATGARWSTQGIATDEFFQAAPNLWACGSVTEKAADSAAAKAQGALAAKNAVGQERESWDKSTLVRVLATDPAIACFGLSENAAREKSTDVKVHRRDFSNDEAAIIEGETRGFVKVVADADGKVIGAHVAGRNAAEKLQPLITAARGGVLQLEL